MGVAKALGDIGSYYQGDGSYGQALTNYLNSLEILEDLGSQKGISTMSNNIGTIFVYTNENEEALYYLTKAIQSCDSVRDPINYGNMLGNVLVAWIRQDNAHSVQYYFDKAVRFQRDIGMFSDLAQTYGNMQAFYEDYTEPSTSEFEQRKMYVDSAFKYATIVNYGPTLITANFHKGLIFSHLGNRDSSVHCLSEMVRLSEKFEYETEDLATSLQLLAVNFAEEGDYKKAYEFELKSKETALRMDQRKMDESLHQVKVQFQINEVKKELALAHKTQALIESELERAELSNERKDILAKEKQIQIYLIAVGLVIALMFIFIIYRAYNQKKQANRLIQSQKEEVEAKRNEIEIQKQLVEEKKDELEASIFYAKRIQEALLPSLQLVRDKLPNSFIWYRPKEVVSGDFYWIKSKEQKTFFTVADSTGHGVPAALVASVCSNSLNRAAENTGFITTGELLTKTHELLTAEFAKNTEHLTDGMDIALCAIEGRTLSISGANRPVWICREGEFIELEGEPTTINAKVPKTTFKTHTVELLTDDVVYLFTNGLIDQFGGEEGKKLRLSNLRRLLQAVYRYDSAKQRDMLQKAFEDWRGNMEQIDDICIMGIKISD